MQIYLYLIPRGKKILNRILCLAIAILIAAVSSSAAATTGQITDIDITLAVDRQLQSDEGVAAHLIDVRTRDGVVTLSGSVDNLMARERAGEIAATVKGVRSVINLIEVLAVVRSDDQIGTDVKLALMEDPATDIMDVDVDVQKGTVFLGGKVDSWQEKRLCELVAKTVIGVKAVKSNIAVLQKSKRPDDEIQADIEQRLAYDVWIDNAMIEVRVVGGNVFLNGIVASLTEKHRAAAAGWVAGVSAVDDSGIRVDWNRLNQKRQTAAPYPVYSDEDVRQAVKAAFFYDPRLSRFDIRVSVDHGVVMLSGTVPNLKARQVAERDARNTIGVWSVNNHLKVRPGMSPLTPPQPDLDAELAKKVRLALLRNPYTHQHEIGVAVSNRLVMLTGTVNTNLEKNKAEDVAATIKGIAGVTNNLRVRQNWTPKDDWEIKKDIQTELWWSPYVDEEDVSVTVTDGVAALVGVVDTLQERRMATENAYEGGARQVRNHLKVRHGPDDLKP